MREIVSAIAGKAGAKETVSGNPQKWSVIAILIALAYLSAVNLDYAPLWDDEAVMAMIARNFLEQGATVVDDGRFVVSLGAAILAEGSGDITQDMRFRYPPLTFYTTALGFSIFGQNETGARLMSVFFTLGAMLLFWGILRRENPARPWFAVSALGLASFSQMVVLYARSATYNALSMFLALLLFHLYLAFCERARIRTAVAIATVAVLGFHTQYLISASFIFAMIFFHLLFRRATFTRRSWVLTMLAGVPYLSQAIWYRYFDPDLLVSLPHVRDSELATMEKLQLFLSNFLPKNFILLNDNGIVFWTAALMFAAWRVFLLFDRRPKTSKHGRQGTNSSADTFSGRLAELGQCKSFQYLVFILLATLGTALLSPQQYGDLWIDVRYYSAIAPFGAIVSAEILAVLWKRSNVASIVFAVLILCTSLPAWPWAFHKYYGHSWRWTLPAQVLEFHREYPSALAVSVEYLRANAAQNDLVLARTPSMRPRLAFYLGDKLLFGGTVSRLNNLPSALRETKRKYIFIENIMEGITPPDWIVLNGVIQQRRRFNLPDGSQYHIATILKIPSDITAFYRPEPNEHTSYPFDSYPHVPVLVYRKDTPK